MDNSENPRTIHINTPKGDFLITNNKRAMEQPDFMDALMDFQYGSAEESDKGYQKMMEITGVEKQPGKIRIESIAQTVNNNGVEPDEQEGLFRVSESFNEWNKLLEKNGKFLGNYSKGSYSSLTYLDSNFSTLVESGLQYANQSATHIIKLAGSSEEIRVIFSRMSAESRKLYRKDKEPKEFNSELDIFNLSLLKSLKINSISELEEFLEKQA